jgi:DNA-binding MarR family transcriptional regulator
MGRVTTQASREAWRTILRLMFDGEGHGRMPQVCRSIGIPPSMIKTLMHLSPDEPQAMRDLADHWGCDASYVTALIDDLEERGFAERRPHPTDRRIRTVVLTAAGAEVKGRVTEKLWEPPPAFSALTAAEQRELRDLLRKVANADSLLAAAPRTRSP